MRHILIILSIFLFSFIIFSCGEKGEHTTTTSDITAPVIAEVTAVTTPTNDTTPDYTFSSTETGTITYGGSCSSETTSATSGNNTITFIALSDGTYSDCTIIVTDSAGNASNTLAITSFTIDTGVFVAVGNSGTILTSSGGTTWTTVSATDSDNGSNSLLDHVKGVTYGSSTFVAVGTRSSGSPSIITSTDATAWTHRTSGTSNTLYDVTYKE